MPAGKHISKLAGPILTVTMLGLAACTGEATDQAAAGGTAAELAEGQDTMGTEGMARAPHGKVSTIAYECADGGAFTLTIAEGVGKAALRLADGEIHQLDQAEVASGMEYSNGTYTFRGKGAQATVEMDGEPLLSDCEASGHPQ